MNRERAVRAALLMYPAEQRERSGAEMTATLLDVSAGSRRRFTREIFDLAWHGRHARARRLTADGTRRVIADGLCLAGVWFMTLDLATLLAQRVRHFQDPLLAPPSVVLLAAALVLALVGYDRVAGAAALIWTAARFPELIDHHTGATVAIAVATLPSATCFAVLAIAPRERPRDIRRLAWLIVPTTLVIALGPPPYEQSPVLIALIAAAAVLVIVYALAMLATDPRVAIAGAVPLTALGLGVHPTMVVLPAAPLVLVIVVVRVSRLRRQVPI